MRLSLSLILVAALVGCGDGGGTTGTTGGFGGSGGSGGTGGGGGSTFDCTAEGVIEAIRAGGGPNRFSCDGPTTIEFEEELVIRRDANLDGGGNITLDGGGERRVLGIDDNITVILTGFSFANGVTPGEGAGVQNAGNLTLSDCTISGNTAGAEECELTEESPCSRGGGVQNAREATLTIERCTIAGNTANRGGGIFNEGTMTLTDSSVTGSTARGCVSELLGPCSAGGGVLNVGTLDIVRATVADNQAATFGGGVRNDSTISIRDTTISGNRANRGAGFTNIEEVMTGTSNVVAEVTNATIVDNEGRDGGGVYNEAADMVIASSTIANNAAEQGEALFVSSTGTVTIRNTIAAGNCRIPLAFEMGELISDGGNIESPGDTCGLEASTDQVGVGASSLALGSLADNGGPTATLALEAGSVALDTVPVSACEDAAGETLTEDQRGVARPQGAECDAGAFELEESGQ